jgi:hypothetical protein
MEKNPEYATRTAFREVLKRVLSALLTTFGQSRCLKLCQVAWAAEDCGPCGKAIAGQSSEGGWGFELIDVGR